MNKLQVRLVSPWQSEVETETAVFSVRIPTEKADALLCEWAPSSELFTFPRRKAWYCCEPQCQFHRLGGGRWPRIKSQLGVHEFLWHGHRNERYRVPHVTHFEQLVMNTNCDRLDKAIAIVSNHGGSPWRRHRDIAYRNRIITAPGVDLYGREGWRQYRAHWFSRAAVPANYKGEIPGDWPAGEKRQLMARYKVAICLENMNEPHYFTEKFVEAVVAGCVPVYRATEDQRSGILRGAFWVDPNGPGLSKKLAVKSALGLDLGVVQSMNQRWIHQSGALAGTKSQQVFSRIAQILSD